MPKKVQGKERKEIQFPYLIDKIDDAIINSTINFKALFQNLKGQNALIHHRLAKKDTFCYQLTIIFYV